ncbi:MAG: urease accessory protein UreF [Sulfurimicrobium sp.]|jgi:urease accessory protein|nr:urease accessory protein UreF [Sulfurimicrobium sp.]
MNLALIRLLHLASPTLPVGAYTYSQGLEWAVETSAIRNEADALLWIRDCMEFGIARFEAVYLARMQAAWQRSDMARLTELDAEFIASRESAELRAETLQMGYSLTRLLNDLSGFPAQGLAAFATPSFPLAWSCAAAHWAISGPDAVAGYLWAWAENQVMAAVKAVPLGQTAGQRMLLELGSHLPRLAEAAVSAPLVETHNYLPAFAIACCRHETQYTRLFRS